MDASYRLLGPLTALRGDAVIDLGPPKQRAALALLLLHRGRQVSTDRLVDALWGEAPPPSALASIQAYVSNLRRALRGTAGASAVIVRRAQGYVLEVPPDRVDLARFHVELAAARAASEVQDWSAALAHADGALALWRGELLEDLSDQDWVRGEAEAVAALRTECRETQITALLAAQRVAPALAAAVELRQAHPLRDRACWLLMLALHRAGRTAEALDAYTEHARRLDADLGLEPGAELRELQVAILRHEPALTAWPRPAGWTGAARLHSPGAPAEAHPTGTHAAGAHPAGAPALSFAGRPVLAAEPDLASPLVGRDRETRLVDELLADVGRGNARWLVLTGPAGIGKTRLAEELVARMRGLGGRDAWSRCSEEDGAPAWWPIRQLVRALGEDPDALLVPPAEVDADAARFALYERVAERLQRAAAAAPLAVVVDDVQWADPTSARCLAYLVGALREVPVAFALTLRDGFSDAAVDPLLQALARSDGQRQLAVGPLALADVRVLANTIAGDPLSEREADELARRTGGNPLFVSEYARLPTEARVQGDTPLAVRSVLGRRISGLDPEILQVLRAAAVIGDVVDLPALAATLGMEPDVVAEALDEAADEHVLVPSQDTAGYAFAHGLLRDELLAGLPAMRRRRLHARVAAALDGHDGDSVSRRAQHLVAALGIVESDEVVDACVAAARVAEARWSSEVACEWWAEALRVHDLQPGSDADTAGPREGAGHDPALPGNGSDPREGAGDGPANPRDAAAARDARRGAITGLRGRDRRDALLVAQVAALARAGRGQTVLDVLVAALLDAARAGRARTVGRLASSLLRSAGAWPWPTYGDDPGPLLERLQSLEPFVEGDPVAHASLLAAVAVGRCYDPDPDVPAQLSARALAIADAHGDPEAVADALLGRLLTYSGVASFAEEILELAARLIGLPHREARVDAAIARAVASMAHLSLGDVAAATEDVRLAVAETDVLQLPVIRVQLRWMEGTLATWRGDFDDAHRHYEIGTRVHLQTELYYAGSAALAKLSLRRERDGLAGADPAGTFEWEPWDAAIAAARGDLVTAEHRLTDWLDAQSAWIWITLGHVTLLADTVVEARLTALAPRLYALLEPYAGRIAVVGHIGVINTIDYALGRLLALMGETRAARVVLERALEQARALGGAPTVARCVRALEPLRA